MCPTDTDTPTSPGSGPGAGSGTGGPTEPCPEPELEIVDRKTGNVVSGTTQNTVVGKKIELRVRTRPTGHTMTNIQWTIPGETVKTYTQSTGRGEKTDLQPADLQSAPVDFYWINRGTNTVQVTADVDGSPKSASVTYNVLRPTMDRFDITTSSVNVTDQHFSAPGSPGLAAYEPGPPRRFGSQWDARVTAPAGGDGQIGFTQKILVNRTRTTNAGNVQHFSSGGAFVLDDGLGIQYSGPQPIAAGGSATLNGNPYADSPRTPLTANLSSKSADESFELYLMYRPDGGDSIWVTLGMGTWGWAGSTTRIGAPGSTHNNWNPATGTSMPSSNGTDSTTLPEWTSNFSAVSWT